ncbi:MAG: thioredoxin-disulfide reductase [Dehalococcoidia bacterium]|nr:Thioredoxin reductase [Chloroflexota bacterium]MBT9160069.1 Thioredoxin reductase [Chloroflexota bacterium]MBT9162463.1 Thioredoxin reductase [Chloroflexota bacterium]
MVHQQNNKLHDVIIIGSGPAGLTAAIYASRAGLATLLLTGMFIGGQAATTDRIENYPGFPEGISGEELTNLMLKQAERFGAQVVIDQVTQANLLTHPFGVKTDSEQYEAKALVIATGASPHKLGVPGEEEFIGRGVSFCATCDGFFYQDKSVIVVGGGNSAIEEALFLTKFASRVYVVHRRDRLRADDILQKRVAGNERIELVWDSIVTQIVGDAQVGGVRLKNLKTGQVTTLAADGVFVYIGNAANTQLFVGQIELDEQGYIVTDARQRTSIKGVFAAGDVQERVLQQVVTACCTGARAAMEAEKFIAKLEDRAYPGLSIES